MTEFETYIIILIIASIISLVILYYIIRGAVKSAMNDVLKNFQYLMFLKEESLNEQQLSRARINYQLHLLQKKYNNGSIEKDQFEKKRSMYLDELKSVKQL